MDIGQIKPETRAWLLDPADPGPRYLALRDVFRLAPDDPVLIEARKQAHLHGPIAEVLTQMQPEGFWVQGGSGYSPKYTGTDWSVTLLGQLGAHQSMDARLRQACAYLLDFELHPGGLFSANRTPSGTIDCLQGNLIAALLDMGCSDPRLDAAVDWMACSLTGEGIAPQEDRKAPRRYYAYHCGPNFQCGPNNKLPCAWGAAKVMLAFGKLPKAKYTPAVERAIHQGIEFLFSVDPASANYPAGWAEKPSGNWWKFGFPVYYITDILQVVEALVLLGCKADPRLKNALDLVESKQDANGCWAQEYNYGNKTWGDYGRRGKPNKWVTVRALRVLT